MKRLFVYGSLQPGGPNEHVLAEIGGDWQAGVIRGRLVEQGWGASMGYPGVVIDDSGTDIEGFVLSSPDLDSLWDYLDEFEGAEYERIEASVALVDGERVLAHVYVLRASDTARD